MTQYPFEHAGPVFITAYNGLKTVYYCRDGKKYQRRQRLLTQNWLDVAEEEIDNDYFWMTVACIERSR